MLVKIVLLFLIGMAALAVAGRLGLLRRGDALDVYCRSCGRPRVGRAPCDCGRG